MPDDDRKTDEIEGLGWIVGGAAVFAVGCWALPTLVCAVHARRVPPLSVPEAVASLGRLTDTSRLVEPATAYPPDVAALMPGPVLWWLTTLAVLLVVGGTVTLLVRQVEPLVARERLGRRAFDVRGARPRPWGRPRDLRLKRGASRGFSVGRLDGRDLWTEEEAHVAVVAPTRAGKTTRCVIPWLLEHDGPAIVTSTKRDVLEATIEQRSQRGTAWIFDPFGDDGSSWTPLVGCESWSYALRQAQWLADASAEGSNEIARFWRAEAAKFLAPLLHAAALSGRGMTDVLRWVDKQATLREVDTVLLNAEAQAAADQLAGIRALDDRNRGTTVMSAAAVLAGYRYPEVAAATGRGITVDRFLKEGTNTTLYVVAAERHQRLLAPLVVSLISSIVNGVAEGDTSAWEGRRLRVLLDEAANIAPLSELPRMLSQAAGHGIRFATVWQSLAQLKERHGVAADTVLANSTAKVFMGPISDETTRRYLQGMLGGREHDREPQDGRRATSGSLQQLERGRALLFSADRLPAVADLTPYWRR